MGDKRIIVSDPINIDDPAGKVVGRRRVRDVFSYGMKLQHAAAQMIALSPRPAVRRGVYRFRTFEEADEWMNRMWTTVPT